MPSSACKKKKGFVHFLSLQNGELIARAKPVGSAITSPLYLQAVFFFFLMIRRPPRSTLFPYTTLSDLAFGLQRRRRTPLRGAQPAVRGGLAAVIAGERRNPEFNERLWIASSHMPLAMTVIGTRAAAVGKPCPSLHGVVRARLSHCGSARAD